METAMLMAENGARVIIVGRNQEGLDEAVTKVRSHAQMTMMERMQEGGNGDGFSGMAGSQSTMTSVETGGAPYTEMEDKIVGMEADVTNFEQVKSVADQVVQRFGRIDTWVNLAAVSEWALFEDTSPDEFHRIIEVNLLGQAYGAMASLPYLKQQTGGGALIFVSSIAGRAPIPYQSAYNASKHGVLGLVETLRQEVKYTESPVSVTAILPASVSTPMFEKARTKIGVEPEPIKPVYEVRMAARAIAYAAQHPVRELIVGDSGYMITFMRRLAPTLTSNYLGAAGFRQQRSQEFKSSQAPDNLYEHVSEETQVEGEYTPVKKVSPLTWFSTHPKARMALYGALLAGLGVLVGRRVVNIRRERLSWRYKLPRQAKRFTRQASKTAEKALSGMPSPSDIPVVSRMPMFHKKTPMERISDRLSKVGAGIIALIPFIPQKKSAARRITDRLPEVSMPWSPSKPSTLDRLTLSHQRQAAIYRFARQSSKVMEKMDKQRKDTLKKASRTMTEVGDRRK
ncbi:MAG: SDR family NAD(P)-dependent oxidoreductase, partial [Chloroflexi bacterium]